MMDNDLHNRVSLVTLVASEKTIYLEMKDFSHIEDRPQESKTEGPLNAPGKMHYYSLNMEHGL
jgi:hypothetical protein